jgi:hypothetical protein
VLRFPVRLVTDSLGLLVLIVAARGLEALDEGDVLLLGLLGGGAVVDDLLPCVLLGLALDATDTISAIEEHVCTAPG